MFSFRCTLCLMLLTLVPYSWSYTFGQPAFTLQRFLDENPSQQPLQEQLVTRVHSPPTPLTSLSPDTQKIALVLGGSEHELKNQAWLMAFKRRMQELNIGFRLDLYHIPESADIASVVQVFKTLESAQFDYLIVDGVDEYNRPILARILRQSRPKLIMLNTTAPVLSWRNHPPLLYIGVDSSKIMHRLASYVDRRLERNAVIDVIAVRDAYINETRCQVFMNELQSLGRRVRRHFVIEDRVEEASKVASLLVNRLAPHGDISEHFVFSCTPKLSQGVLQRSHGRLLTNAWIGQSSLNLTPSRTQILVTVLDMYDNMAIATAEAIKASIESRLLPTIYTESSRLLSQEMDQQTRDIMFQQAFRYSSSIWPH